MSFCPIAEQVVGFTAAVSTSYHKTSRKRLSNSRRVRHNGPIRLCAAVERLLGSSGEAHCQPMFFPPRRPNLSRGHQAWRRCSTVGKDVPQHQALRPYGICRPRDTGHELTTRASRATAWLAPSSFIGSVKSATALTTTSSATHPGLNLLRIGHHPVEHPPSQPRGRCPARDPGALPSTFSPPSAARVESASISPAITSGRAPTRRRKTITDPAPPARYNPYPHLNWIPVRLTDRTAFFDIPAQIEQSANAPTWCFSRIGTGQDNRFQAGHLTLAQLGQAPRLWPVRTARRSLRHCSGAPSRARSARSHSRQPHRGCPVHPSARWRSRSAGR